MMRRAPPQRELRARERRGGETRAHTPVDTQSVAHLAAECENAGMTERIARWHAAWEARDVERILALYADDATHASPLVRQFCPEAPEPVLRGRERIGEYFRRALGRFTWLRFEIVSVTEDTERSAFEYRRHSNVDGDRPAHVLELLEWRDGLIVAVRVFHFS